MNREHSRRSFLTRVGAAALAPVFIPRDLFAVDVGRKTQAFAPRIGVCTSVRNAQLLRQAGCDYIEESVRRLLMPDRSDDEFATNLKAARDCGLPVLAALGGSVHAGCGVVPRLAGTAASARQL